MAASWVVVRTTFANKFMVQKYIHIVHLYVHKVSHQTENYGGTVSKKGPRAKYASLLNDYCTLSTLKVHKREKFFGSDFEFFTIL